MNVGIITITDVNYGNRLQNYATYKFSEKLSLKPQNIIIYDARKKTIIKKTKDARKRIVKKMVPAALLAWKWEKNKDIYKDTLDIKKEKIFQDFTDLHMNSRSIKLYYTSDLKKIVRNGDYHYFFAGSDQIWNPDFAGDDYYFLSFVEGNKRIAFVASIGYENLSNKITKRYTKYWDKMQYISVREESAAEIIEKVTGKRPDVFLDPTMLLTRMEWEQISVKPSTRLPKKYVVCLFLGSVPQYLKEVFDRFYDMDIVVLNDKEYPNYYLFSPSEFVYVIQNAQMILTDSFHCTVFSIIFHKQFWVFKREQSDLGNMFTRLENLLKKMNFLDRVWKDKNGEQLYVDYMNNNITEDRFVKSDLIMEKEQEKAIKIMKELLHL